MRYDVVILIALFAIAVAVTAYFWHNQKPVHQSKTQPRDKNGRFVKRKV